MPGYLIKAQEKGMNSILIFREVKCIMKNGRLLSVPKLIANLYSIFKYTANLYLGRCSRELRYILGHSVITENDTDGSHPEPPSQYRLVSIMSTLLVFEVI